MEPAVEQGPSLSIYLRKTIFSGAEDRKGRGRKSVLPINTCAAAPCAGAGLDWLVYLLARADCVNYFRVFVSWLLNSHQESAIM